MAAEPKYIAQSRCATEQEAWAWIQKAVHEDRDQGCTHGRASRHAEQADLYLYEAWEERPDDEGEPRFALQREGGV